MFLGKPDLNIYIYILTKYFGYYTEQSSKERLDCFDIKIKDNKLIFLTKYWDLKKNNFQKYISYTWTCSEKIENFQNWFDFSDSLFEFNAVYHDETGDHNILQSGNKSEFFTTDGKHFVWSKGEIERKCILNYIKNDTYINQN